MDLFVNAKEGKGKSHRNARDRKAGSIGSGASENHVGTYEALVLAVKEFKGGKHNSVSMAFHPEPKDEMIQTRKGWVRVMQGEAGYQLNSGEFVKV